MTDDVDPRGGTDERGGYVHDPATFDEERGRAKRDHDTGERRAASEAPPEPRGRGPDREFGWRGWVLVGFLLVAFVVVPTLLYYVPRAQGFVTSLGLSLRDAYLVLPLLPALVLGALAVWATTRP